MGCSSSSSAEKAAPPAESNREKPQAQERSEQPKQAAAAAGASSASAAAPTVTVTTHEKQQAKSDGVGVGVGATVQKPITPHEPYDGKPKSGNDFKARYQLKQVLGKGNYSVVKEAVDSISEERVAVKCIEKKKLTKEDEEGLKLETGILAEISHPNIITLHGVYEDPKNYFIVTELMEGGELFDRIVKKEYYSEEDAQKVVRTLGSAIKYCHDRGIVHRDLKPENILMKDLKDDAAIKIADFGFARREADGLRTACGTPGYVAPEIIKNVPYGREVDMWSLGVIIYILLCGYPPFYNQNQNLLFQQIRSGQFEFDSPYWDPVSEEAKDLIRGLLTVDPKKRLTVDGMLNHRWVSASVSDKDITGALSELKKFNARRKIRAGAKAALAAAAFSNIIKKLGEAATEIEAQKQADAAAAASAGENGAAGADAAQADGAAGNTTAAAESGTITMDGADDTQNQA